MALLKKGSRTRPRVRQAARGRALGRSSYWRYMMRFEKRNLGLYIVRTLSQTFWKIERKERKEGQTLCQQSY